MNLHQLEYFIKVYKTKNFTKASNLLSVTQPTLSKAILKLETELDVPLFERDGRNIKATDYGKVFYKYIESSLKEIEKGKEKISDMKNRNDNSISLGSTHCIGSTFMPFLISKFLNNNLNVKFNFNTESQDKILKDLKGGKIDLGFIDSIDNIGEYPEIEAKLIKEEEFVLIVSKNHHLANKEEVTLDELKDEYFVGFNSKDNSNNLSYPELIGYNPKISVEPDTAGMYAGLVAEGAGIAIVLNSPFINTNKISVIKIKDNINHKRIYMAWNKESFIPRKTLDFKEFVLNVNY